MDVSSLEFGKTIIYHDGSHLSLEGFVKRLNAKSLVEVQEVYF